LSYKELASRLTPKSPIILRNTVNLFVFCM
jgi:hypothetical protein